MQAICCTNTVSKVKTASISSQLACEAAFNRVLVVILGLSSRECHKEPTATEEMVIVDDEGSNIPQPMAISRTIRACIGDGSEREEMVALLKLLWSIELSCYCCLLSGSKGVHLVVEVNLGWLSLGRVSGRK